MLVNVGVDVDGARFVAVGEPADRMVAVGLFEPAIEFRAVAGGQNRRFSRGAAGRYVAQDIDQVFGRDDRPFADLQRCGLMVDSEGEQMHV